MARARERRAHLAPPPTPRDLRAATALWRDHDAAENDMVAIDAQMQVLQEEGSRLQRLRPGGNSQQIALRQQALSEAWRSVTSSRGRHPSAARCHPQLPQAQQQLRAEKEARDDCFKDVLARGQRLLDEERPSSAEIEERCRAAGGGWRWSS
ncbi:unnamed protein product [Danaus chrysippus]|uniref:(African queen) hypothetical protein n=1 Tax=Danaus chrysippus TaxID=151541 RepID=A0A8J2QYE8_9NEOP|nr:unnamed protein product [Danaus chrysippus]